MNAVHLSFIIEITFSPNWPTVKTKTIMVMVPTSDSTPRFCMEFKKVTMVGKARQGNFIYVALFIQKADSKCFTYENCHTIQ